MRVGDGGKARSHRRPVMGDGLIEVAQQRQAADGIPDVDEALRIELRADVVEHHRLDKFGAWAAKQHGVDPPRDRPTKMAEPIPSCSRTAAMSPASTGTE